MATRQWALTEAQAFDLFLSFVQQARGSGSSFLPIDLHFTTHTATVWDDVVDEQGKMLLTRTFRLDDLTPALNAVFESCSLPKRLEVSQKKLNKNSSRRQFQPTAAQRSRIERLFAKDFELYETSGL